MVSGSEARVVKVATPWYMYSTNGIARNHGRLGVLDWYDFSPHPDQSCCLPCEYEYLSSSTSGIVIMSTLELEALPPPPHQVKQVN